MKLVTIQLCEAKIEAVCHSDGSPSEQKNLPARGWDSHSTQGDLSSQAPQDDSWSVLSSTGIE